MIHDYIDFSRLTDPSFWERIAANDNNKQRRDAAQHMVDKIKGDHFKKKGGSGAPLTTVEANEAYKKELEKSWGKVTKSSSSSGGGSSGGSGSKLGPDDVAVPKTGFFRKKDGSGEWDKLKIGGAIGLGALGVAGIAKLAHDNKKRKQEAEEQRNRMLQMMALNSSEVNDMDTISNVFLGNDGIRIAGTGAAEALAATMGEYAEYADNDQIVSAAVDALRIAQVTKLNNTAEFSENDAVDLESIEYSVGDLVAVTPEISGRIIEILPLPASFSDPTVNYQVMLDNGALCNVTDSGALWVEMSENNEIVTTPLAKFSAISFGDATFSTADLGLVDIHHRELANFSLQDYLPNFGTESYEQFQEGEEGTVQEEQGQYSEDYLIGYNIAQHGTFSDAELVSYARTNNFNLNEIISGYNDSKTAQQPAPAPEAQFSQQHAIQNFSQPQLAAPVNFSAVDYNTVLDELVSWKSDVSL